MFVANHFGGLIERQSVVIGSAGEQGEGQTPWYDRPGRRVLPGLGHLRVIRTTVFF